ncbi:MAG: hypothetical protein H6867_05320 [Rhodospirillales bacterium]|nr:hypothetical protein [Rhodospirillales bacterium]MCB9994949.1 hypothetical protein [Rhodospirillales bacterium]
MKITQFKKMVALHGADVTRWDGADIDAVKALIRESEEARALYNEAQALDDALDRFKAGSVDLSVLDDVMVRIGGEPVPRSSFSEELKAARPGMIPDDVPAPEVIAARAAPRPMIWMTAAAFMAALVVSVVFFRGEGDISVQQAVVAEAPQMQEQETVLAQTDMPAEEVDRLMLEMGDMVDDELAAHEMIGLLAMAETEVPQQDVRQQDESVPQSEEDIDAFLDQLFDDAGTDPALQQEMDLWKLFLEGQTREL